MSFDRIRLHYDTLKEKASAGKWEEICRDLHKLKTDLIKISCLATDMSDVPTHHLVIARDVLEMEIECIVYGFGDAESVYSQSFTRYMNMLKPYYFDFAERMEESPKRYLILGLNLLYLLSKNEIALFHTELELIKKEVIENDVFIKFPVKLERYIMMGSYKKALDRENKLPSPAYELFMKTLLLTIREEIAKGMEVAYTEISANECEKLLNLSSGEATKYFADKKWVVNGNNMVQFPRISDEGDKRTADNSDAMDQLAKTMSEQVLRYAKELERIV